MRHFFINSFLLAEINLKKSCIYLKTPLSEIKNLCQSYSTLTDLSEYLKMYTDKSKNHLHLTPKLFVQYEILNCHFRNMLLNTLNRGIVRFKIYDSIIPP